MGRLAQLAIALLLISCGGVEANNRFVEGDFLVLNPEGLRPGDIDFRHGPMCRSADASEKYYLAWSKSVGVKDKEFPAFVLRETNGECRYSGYIAARYEGLERIVRPENMDPKRIERYTALEHMQTFFQLNSIRMEFSENDLQLMRSRCLILNISEKMVVNLKNRCYPIIH